MVDAVVREVRAPAAVPAERRRLPVEDALPLLEPWKRLGRLAPELLGVVGRALLPARDLRVDGHWRSRSLYRWIFPVAVFGSSSTNSIQRGYLYGAMRLFTNCFSSSPSA